MFGFLDKPALVLERPRRGTTPGIRSSQQGTHVESDEPMAGAGAQLAGEREFSETEQTLRRASVADRSRGQ